MDNEEASEMAAAAPGLPQEGPQNPPQEAAATLGTPQEGASPLPTDLRWRLGPNEGPRGPPRARGRAGAWDP